MKQSPRFWLEDVPSLLPIHGGLSGNSYSIIFQRIPSLCSHPHIRSYSNEPAALPRGLACGRMLRGLHYQEFPRTNGSAHSTFSEVSAHPIWEAPLSAAHFPGPGAKLVQTHTKAECPRAGINLQSLFLLPTQSVHPPFRATHRNTRKLGGERTERLSLPEFWIS